MRKSIQWTATISAAAAMMLLSAGLTIPAMAQTGNWVEEDGTWKYYDADGYVLTDSWKKYNDAWVYLDEDGNITLNSQIDEYYVDATGKRVANQWVELEAEDEWDEEAPGTYWYYYGANGKMVAGKFKTIDEKTYYFDEEGRMAVGLREIDGANYYFSGSGYMKKGWVKLPAADDEFGDEMVWSYFDSTGKRIENQLDKKINGGYYTFVNGEMITGWYKLPEQAPAAETETGADQNEDAAETELAAAADHSPAAGYQYYDESGKRASGWMTIAEIPGVSDEDETYRFYFKNGVPHHAAEGLKIFSIGSDRYAFNDKGEMQTGLQSIKLEDGSTANFYFNAQGAMETGKQTIYDEESDMNQTWYFHTEGAQRGQGYNGIRSNVIYENGLRKEASADLKYEPVMFEGQKYLVNASGTIQKASSTSKSTTRPDLGSGYRDVRDANETVWVVDVNGIVQQ